MGTLTQHSTIIFIDAFSKHFKSHSSRTRKAEGTNVEVSKDLIDKSGLKVQSAILLSEAADFVNKAVA
ncbi:MAG: hypothetical protein ABI683_10500 [Ginsengibacter sp.]